VRFARTLARAGVVHAAVDISDGLAADLAHVCDASGVGVRVSEAALPVDAALEAAARTLSAKADQERGRDAHGARMPPSDEAALLTRLRLGASDDYELLLAIDPAKWTELERLADEAMVPLARIGDCTAGGARVLVTASGTERAFDIPGWDHFSNRG
jgi:thiamine-monophosphate kinase